MIFCLFKKKILLLATFIIFLSTVTNQAYSNKTTEDELKIKFIIGDDVSEAFYSKAKELFFTFNVFCKYNNYLKTTTPEVYIWSCPSKNINNTDNENHYTLYEYPNLFSTRKSDACDNNLTSMVNDYLYSKDRVMAIGLLSRLKLENRGLFLLYAEDIKTGDKIGAVPDQPHKLWLLLNPLKLFVKFRFYEAKKLLPVKETEDKTSVLLNPIIAELGISLENDDFNNISDEEKLTNIGVYYMIARLGLIPEIVEYLHEINTPLHFIDNLKIWQKFSPEQENLIETLEYIFDTKNLMGNDKTTMDPFKGLFNWFKN